MSASKKLVIYISGPYRADCPFDVHRNILAAAELAVSMWRSDMVAICPHLNTAFFDFYAPAITHEEFIEGDLELVRRSDALVTVGNWRDSAGARTEIALAKSRGIPVFHSKEELFTWHLTAVR
jgi:hypothetical protein